MTHVRVKTALLSVSDKTGLAELASSLRSHEVELISTGGTRRAIADAGMSVLEVSDYTGSPEMMNGRVKTLHPKIHGGLLGRRGPDDEVMAAHNIREIDLLVVNLYPFEHAVTEEPCNLLNAIDNIDIGGPAMLRSAAKNYDSVAVVVDCADYLGLVDEMNSSAGCLCLDTRFTLAVKAFEYVARYDAAIANYLSGIDQESNERMEYSGTMTLQFRRHEIMRYGENPHQSAAFYVEANRPRGSIASALQRQGKSLSYNNIADADVALQCVKAFSGPSCVIVKHANPCGVAEAENLLEAYGRAFKTDPTSAFGGIIAFNSELKGDLARRIIDQQFVEVIAAPAVTSEALDIFAEKENIRVLELSDGGGKIAREYKGVEGGLLVQSTDHQLLDESEVKVVTNRNPSVEEEADLIFAWTVAKYVKSNAIVYAKDKMTIGIGAGQMARVTSATVAAIKAEAEGLKLKGSVMASDAFIPFRDSVDTAADAGITAIIQPGGSVRDQEVIDAANEYGIAMILTGMRHFRH